MPDKMPDILQSERSEQILTLTLNRPEKLNALSQDLLDALRAALDVAKDDDAVSVVIIRAQGRVFSAGYDLNEKDWVTSQYPANFPNGVDYDTDKDDINTLLDLWLHVWDFPKPIIATVQGPCLSGAGELIAMCDIVIASENASFGHPAARDLGIPPTVFLWPLLIGMRKTKEMLYTARAMSAQEALDADLINTVVAPQDLDEYTRSLALDIAKTPVAHLILLKQSANRFYENMDMVNSMRHAATMDADFHQSPTFLAFFKTVRERGMKAALIERAKRFGP